MNNYILDKNGNPVAEPDVIVWAKWWEANREKRIVKQDTIGRYWVSTIFLGLDHNFSGGAPILWETMIFDESKKLKSPRYVHFPGKEKDKKHRLRKYPEWEEQYQQRYASASEAIKGHTEACKKAVEWENDRKRKEKWYAYRKACGKPKN